MSKLIELEDSRSPSVKAFLAEIAALCKKYQMSLGHEDALGSFQVTQYSQCHMDWLLNADDKTNPVKV